LGFEGLLELEGEFEQSGFVGTGDVALVFEEALFLDLFCEEVEFLFKLFVFQSVVGYAFGVLFLGGEGGFL
jgi:hypothetical protein